MSTPDKKSVSARIRVGSAEAGVGSNEQTETSKDKVSTPKPEGVDSTIVSVKNKEFQGTETTQIDHQNLDKFSLIIGESMNQTSR